MGLEPMLRPWKGRVLPLHHTRINVGAAGFEPTTFRTQTERAPGLRHAPNTNACEYYHCLGGLSRHNLS